MQNCDARFLKNSRWRQVLVRAAPFQRGKQHKFYSFSKIVKVCCDNFILVSPENKIEIIHNQIVLVFKCKHHVKNATIKGIIKNYTDSFMDLKATVYDSKFDRNLFK